jgi:Domain of unknown function (DUF427)
MWSKQRIDEEKLIKAVVGETVVAEAASEAVVSIEGNAYFPPDSVAVDALRNSSTPYIAPGRGGLSITTSWSARRCSGTGLGLTRTSSPPGDGGEPFSPSDAPARR